MAKTGPKGPWKMTEKVIGKLEEAFAIGATDKEACFYADISPDSLYDYQNKHPEFIQRKEALKERPVLLARQSVIKGMEQDPNLALKYLERKARSEFATKTETDLTSNGETLAPVLVKFLDEQQNS